MSQRVLILGGDMRQYYMAKFLVKKDFAIFYFGHLFSENEEYISKIRTLEKLNQRLREEKFTHIVLPVPLGEGCVKGTDHLLTIDHLFELLKYQREAIVWSGKMPVERKNELHKMQIELKEYMEIESIAMKNARLTAENAILEAIMMSDRCIMDSKSLVIGYGRCGQMLADVLRGMGGKVFVCEKEEGKGATAQARGFERKDIEDISGYDFIFQTAPEEDVLSDKVLLTLMSNDRYKECVILNLSSVRNSVNLDFVGKQRLLCKQCPGLPAKYTPKSAGELLASCLLL